MRRRRQRRDDGEALTKFRQARRDETGGIGRRGDADLFAADPADARYKLRQSSGSNKWDGQIAAVLTPAAGLPAPLPDQPRPQPMGSSPQYDDWWRQLQAQRFAQAG
jgi:hypothetical protein